MDIPVTYRPANLASSGPEPTGVNLLNNAAAQYYARYLMKRAISAVKLTLPEDWPENYVAYTLFGYGFGAVLRSERYGVIFQGGTCGQRDVYYQPVYFLTANPLLENRPRRIGKECALIKLQPDFCGINDIVQTYAARLALAYQAWVMNTQNSKFSYVFAADNKANAHTFDTVFDAVQSGKPAVVTGNGLLDKEGKPRWLMFNQHIREAYIAPEISEDMRRVMNDFDSFVGIPSANTDKRERLIVDEVNANNVETDTLIDLWVQTLNEGFEKANQMYGLNLKAEKKYKMEVTQNAETNNQT